MKLTVNQLLDKANNAHKKGNYQKAARFYKKILDVQPKNINVYNNLGDALKNLGKTEKAEKNFNMAINLKPNFSKAHYNLGNLLINIKRHEEAIKSYRKEIIANPNFVQAYYNLATIQQGMERYEEAVKNFKKVIELNPNLTEVKHIIASLTGKTTSSAPRAYVEKLFDTYASEFENSLIKKLDYKIPKAMFDLIVNKNSKNSLGSILDLGCGTGLVGLKLKKFCSKLVGIDLSNSMLEKAKKKNVYDELIHQDITDYLLNEELNYDYYIFADVFIYIGELSEIFRLIKLRNKSKGKLLFSTEHIDNDEFVFEKSGRYSHSESYIKNLCKKYDYKVLHFEKMTLRKEKEKLITGGLYLLDF
jgi:predicted TPR repeat methyltransferase